MNERRPMSEAEHDQAEGMTPGWKTDRAFGLLPGEEAFDEQYEAYAASALGERKGTTQERTKTLMEISDSAAGRNDQLQSEILSLIQDRKDLLRHHPLRLTVARFGEALENWRQRYEESKDPEEQYELSVSIKTLEYTLGNVLIQLQDELKAEIG